MEQKQIFRAIGAATILIVGLALLGLLYRSNSAVGVSPATRSTVASAKVNRALYTNETIAIAPQTVTAPLAGASRVQNETISLSIEATNAALKQLGAATPAEQTKP